MHRSLALVAAILVGALAGCTQPNAAPGDGTEAFALACATAAIEIYRDRSWSTIKSVRSAVLFIPRTWWRWQKLYLTSTPVTLGIVSLFAASMRWG